MMKKTLIALSVAGLVAGSASAVTVYNNDGTRLEVNGSARLVLTKQTDKRFDLKNDGSRIKFKFSQQIGDGFSALGFMELRPSDDDFGGGITTKYLYAGFDAKEIGTLTFGRQKSAGDEFKLADPTENFMDVKDFMGMPAWGKKVIDFNSASFYGLSLRTSYLFDDVSNKNFINANGENAHAPNNNGYQVLAKYEDVFGDFGVKLHGIYSVNKQSAYDDLYNTDFQTTKTHQVYGLSGRLEFMDFGFAFDFAKAKQKDGKYWNYGRVLGDDIDNLNFMANKATFWQLATTYQLTNPWDIYAAYHQVKYDNLQVRHYLTGVHMDNKPQGDFKVKGWAAGSHYYLNKNVMTYLEYTSEKGNHRDSQRENKYYAGLRVFF